MVAGGGSTSTVMTEEGAFTSGSTELRTEQVAVVKCKACGEILNSARNYHYTAEELAQLAQLKASKEKKKRAAYRAIMIFLIVLCAAVSLFSLILGFSDDYDTEQKIVIFCGSGAFALIVWRLSRKL